MVKILEQSDKKKITFKAIEKYQYGSEKLYRNTLTETACQCSQIVKLNDASILFYFSSSSFLNFFVVPSVSVLELHCLIKSTCNIYQTVMQNSCESRTVSWKLTTKTDCDVQELRCCQYSVDYIFCTLTLIPELMVEENCLSHQQCKLLNDCWIRQLEGMLLYFA